MRLLNFILHLALVSMMFLAVDLQAQVNGNLPHVVQSGDPNNTNPANAVTNGDWLVGTSCWEAPSSPSAITCTDLNGVIPSITMGNLVSHATCVGNAFDPFCGMQQWWGKATSTGVVNISCTTFPRQNVSNMLEIAGNLAFDAQNQTSFTGVSNPAVSVTTTAQNDIVVASTCPSNTASPTPDPSLQFGQQSVVADIPFFYTNWFRAGAAGSQTATWNGTSPTEVLSAVAFKPTSLTIGTTQLPDGGNGTAYKSCLAAYGGTGAYTWSITAGSLQTGLSLNAGTGCITGTPSVTANNAITFQATDGVTPVTKALNLNIGGSLQTISFGQTSTFTTSPNAASVTAKTNDLLLMCYLGEDSHTSTGYLMPTSNISDTCGDVYVRANPIAGAYYGGLQCFSTRATCSGSISPVYSSSFTGTPLAGTFTDISGAQIVMDDGAINQIPPPGGTSTTLSSSLTTPVPNGVLLALSEMICGGSCSNLSTNSPFTIVSSFAGFHGSLFSLYSQAAATVGSYSAVSNYADSGGMTAEVPVQTLLFIRPAIPSSASFAGEKKRRAMN